MAIRLSKCCNVEVKNKYKCPNCNKICKSYEVENVETIEEPEGMAKVIDIAAIPYYEQEPQDPEPPAIVVPMGKTTLVPHTETSEVANRVVLLMNYVGCSGILKSESHVLGITTNDTEVRTLTAYILSFVLDDLAEFTPILWKDTTLSKVQQRDLNNELKETETLWKGVVGVSIEWVRERCIKAYKRTQAIDVDGLIEKGWAIDAAEKFKMAPAAVLEHRRPIASLALEYEEFEHGYYDSIDHERILENYHELQF